MAQETATRRLNRNLLPAVCRLQIPTSRRSPAADTVASASSSVARASSWDGRVRIACSSRRSCWRTNAAPQAGSRQSATPADTAAGKTPSGRRTSSSTPRRQGSSSNTSRRWTSTRVHYRERHRNGAHRTGQAKTKTITGNLSKLDYRTNA